MFRTKVVIFAGLLACVAAISFWGCEGDQGPDGAIGPQGPQGESAETILNVVATYEIFRDYAGDVELWGRFAANVNYAPSIPELTLNGDQVFLDEDSLFLAGRLSYYDLRKAEGVSTASVEITYTKEDGTPGLALSEINLPSEFSPVDNNIVVLIGDSVAAEWERSSGADAYWIYTSFYFDYFDTADVQQSIMIKFDTILTADDTTLLIPGSDIFPDASEINSIAGFDGFFYVRAVTGPWLPGTANNFTGDAFGVFVGTTDPIYIEVDLGPQAAPKVISGSENSVIHREADGLFREKVRELSRGFIN